MGIRSSIGSVSVAKGKMGGCEKIKRCNRLNCVLSLPIAELIYEKWYIPIPKSKFRFIIEYSALGNTPF